MRTIHIINPAAGKGHADTLLKKAPEDEVYTSVGIGDIERFVKENLNSSEEKTKFVIYGGDGSVNEAVNGVLKSDKPSLGVLRAVGAGSGNDFVKVLADIKEDVKADVIRYRSGDEEKYAINMINIGFDCNVVIKTANYKKKPLVSGSFAYVLGVADVFFKKMGEKFKITLTDPEGNVTELPEEDYLLCAIANGQFCGGGFHNSPFSVISDGVIELLTVKKMSHRMFVSLITDYKRGTHLKEDRTPIDKFKGLLSYYSIKKMKIENTQNICADGEIFSYSGIEAEVVPDAVVFACD